MSSTDGTRENRFGWSVAIDGNIAIVGAWGSRSSSDKSGAAYLFDVTTAAELGKLTALDAETNDLFGYSVAISGNIAVIGAPYDDTEAGEDAGLAYVFDVTTQTQIAKLTPMDAAEGDRFGHGVAISGNTAVIGAHLDDDLAKSSGSAYVFNISNTLELAKLTASDGTRDSFLGAYLDVDGDICIVGAYGVYSAYLFTVPEPTTLTLNLLVTLTALAFSRSRMRWIS